MDKLQFLIFDQYTCKKIKIDWIKRYIKNRRTDGRT